MLYTGNCLIPGCEDARKAFWADQLSAVSLTGQAAATNSFVAEEAKIVSAIASFLESDVRTTPPDLSIPFA